MTTRTVYRYSKYDIQSDETIVSKYPATLEAIERFGASPIQDTAREVDSNALDEDGVLRGVADA